MLKKRTTFLLFCFLVIFSLGLTSFVYIRTSPKRELQALTDSLLEDSLAENSLMQHFLISDSLKDSDSPTVTMPVYSKESEAASLQELQQIYDSLISLDLTKADPSLGYLRDSLSFYLAHSLQMSNYEYLEEPFAPYSGVQNELPILLTEFALRDKEDIELYLQILPLIPNYLEGLCQYEREKAEKGMFMSDACADVTIASMDHFCQLEDINNPFLTTFESRLETLLADRIITEEEYTYFINENERLVKTVLLPAYEKTGDTLTVLKSGTNATQQGLCAYENGKQYYEIKISTILGEDVNATSLKNAFSRQLMADFTELNQLLESNPAYFVNLLNDKGSADPLTALSLEECLEFLKKEISRDFAFANADQYPYVVKDVAPSMEDHTNPAYYFTPPIDDSTQNVIYVNRSQTPEGISLFTTLAHEGFPGHLYQSVTSANALASANLPSLAGITYFGGYTEGYATYVEFMSYEYAKTAAAELSGNENASLYYDYLAYNRRICLCLYSILDIMIHYEGAGIAEIRPYLHRIGITTDEDIQAIYNYIVSEPGTYIAYYGGYIKILECRHLAMEHWGENFSNKVFHQLLLEQGPQSFECIKKRIKEKASR